MPTTERIPHAPYIHAVIAAIETATAKPADWWVSDAETGLDGATRTLNAVISWDGDTAPDLYPHGLLLLWDLERGWQYAAMRPDRSNDWPADLPLPTWADPADVAEAARALLADEEPGPLSRPEWYDQKVAAAVKAWVES